MNLSVFIVVFNGAQQLISQIKSLVSTLPKLYYNAINLSKYFEYMHSGKINNNYYTLDSSIKSISLSNVYFSYSTYHNDIIKDITLNVNTNQKIAIVGKNGSGKSTLLKIILGLYLPRQGKVLINNIDLNDLDLNEYREKISIVYQDFKLFAFTIAQNIMLKYDITEDDEFIIMESLKKVNLYDKIANLPKGINTIFFKEFDKDGVLFSGGEIQRLALARAYAKQSDFIILGEAFSSFDVINENENFEVLTNISKGKILILITHRLSNLSKFDKIIVMDNGLIKEAGTHDELLSTHSIYSSMVSLQK